MSDIRRLPSWKRRYTLAPGKTTLLGVAIGCAVTAVCALTPPRDFPYRELGGLLLGFASFGGLTGYAAWLSCDPVRGNRLVRTVGHVAFPMIFGLVVAFPVLWRAGLPASPLVVMVLLASASSLTFYAAVVGLGIIHLVGHLAYPFRKSTEAGVGSRTDGVWDREFDRG